MAYDTKKQKIDKVKLTKNNEPLTSGFVQLGPEGRTIIGSAYLSFIFGGRNSGGLQF